MQDIKEAATDTVQDGSPKISIIIAVYNTAAYLPRCMDSVRAQTYKNLEVILVDDGSTDDSGALCDHYQLQDARVRVIHQKNSGAAAAKNAALDIATGEYIGFVDSDDWITLDMYAYLMGLLKQHHADIAEIMLEVAHSDDHALSEVPEKIEVFDGDDCLIHYFRHNEYAMGLRLYKRSIFDTLRFDEGRMNEDVVAGFLALAAATRLVVSNLPKYYYYSNPQGLSESPLRARDFDLIYAGQRLDELTVDRENQEIRQLALFKKHRAPFTLLVKMAVFGCSAELDERATKTELQSEVRKQYRFLMASNMPLNRKLMLTVACVSYGLLKAMARVYRGLGR